jgi:cellulose biosynthesis protein BcsQ
MALILCHSPKGGVGTSFLTAQIAMLLAQRGYEVAALDFTYQDALKLYFGLIPSQTLPDLADRTADPTVVAGVELLSAHRLGREAGFQKRLQRLDPSPFQGDKLYIADVAAGDYDTKNMLLPHALLHICPLMPRSGSLAVLAKVEPGIPTLDLPKTVFVLNSLDDTRRFSRHSHVFMRELFGAKLAGTVRRDEAVNEAAAMFEPIAKFAPLSVALADLRKLVAELELRCSLVPPQVEAQ